MDKEVRQVPNEKHRRPAAHEEEDLKIGWTEENAAAIAERRSWIRGKGAPLADLQVLKLD
jgi:post-segregation antitoxin (ccd killing protein)